MYHTWFFQKRLSEALDKLLSGAKLLACFSQQKDELILGFSQGEKEHYLCVNLASDAGIISIKDSFARARRNSIDLFPEALDRRVQRVTSYTYDRSFIIQLKGGFGLLFKMHGQRSNLLLVHKNRVTKIFRNNLPGDLQLTPSDLNQSFELNKPNILRLLGRRNSYLIDIEDFEPTHFIEIINQNKLYSGLIDGLPALKMLPIPNPVLETHDPIEASNKLAELHQQHYILGKEKLNLQQHLQKEINQLVNYITKAKAKLLDVKNQRDPQELANLLMANLHLIQSRANEVTVADFYKENSALITIKINPNLSGQLSAQNYYRKAKNKRIELENIESNIDQKSELLVQRTSLLQSLETLNNLKDIRAFRSVHVDKPEKENAPLPFHQYTIDGYQVLVGKNAKSNDQVTMRFSSKNDLWLHARDVSGSHVIIKEKSGQNFPEPVIEKAAQLAAWNSKRKTDSLCPVIYTPRKYVRKVKGAPAGQVVVEKEQVIMVVPANCEGRL